MAKNPWEFLESWAKDNVQATAFDDEPAADHLAKLCLSAARKAGISEASVIKAAGGNLPMWFLAELNSAANAELERLVSKDKR